VKRIRLIGVDVHSSRKLGAYANNNITENQAAVFACDLNANDLFISNAESSGIVGSEVDVTLSGDNAFAQLNFTAGTNELACAGAGNITALTNGSFDTEGAGIGEGNLNLGSGTCGTENDHLGDGILGADNGNALFACELTGLGEILLMGELMTCTEEDGDMLLSQMYVAGRSLNENFVFHGNMFLSDYVEFWVYGNIIAQLGGAVKSWRIFIPAKAKSPLTPQ